MKNNFCRLTVIIIVYLVSRTISLLQLPVFIDEAFYLCWSRQIHVGTANFLVSLVNGIPPLYIWMLTLFIGNLSFDPLLIGRILSVIISLLTLILIIKIAQDNFSYRAAFWGGLVYVLLPFSLMYDRLSLIDPLLQLFGTCILFLIFKKSRTIWYEILLGLILGLAIITKSSAYFYLFLVPSILYIKKFKYIKRLLLIIIVSILIPLILYIIPEAGTISDLNSLFIASPVELLANPFRFLIPNLIQSLRWVLFYWGLGFIFLIFLGLVFSFLTRNKKYILIGIWFSIPFFLENAVAKIFFPRHFFFITSFLAIFLGITIDVLFKRIKNRIVLILGLLLIFIPCIVTDLNILRNIKEVDFPAVEKWQFLESWPSGYGIDKMLAFVNNNAENQEAEYLVEEYNLPYFVLNIYNNKLSKVIISGSIPSVNPSANLKEYFRTDLPLKYLITNQLQEVPESWNLKLIGLYPKVANKTAIRIYQVNP